MVISRMQAREYAERLAFGAEVAAEAMPPATRVRSWWGGSKLGACTPMPTRTPALEARRADSRRRL